jgi:hypothetical protein
MIYHTSETHESKFVNMPKNLLYNRNDEKRMRKTEA